MVYLKQQRPEKVTVPAVRASKERGERLVCLTAYDYPTARIVDEAGTDVILVGDSLGNVVLGYDSTVPVTLEEMIHHTRAVRRGAAGAGAGAPAAARPHRAAESPVMGRLGLTPQSLNKLGSYRLQAKTADAARALVREALLLEEAGAFAVVLEVVPREIAREVTAALHVPTIGIGAGADCDAQILVTHDLLGLSFSKTSPRFVRQYADVREAMNEAIQAYADDVRAGSFPSDNESYPLPADAASELGITRDAGDKETKKS